MKSYCLNCRKDTEIIDPEILSSSNSRAIILWKCPICGSKKSKFVKNQEAKGLLRNLSIKTVPILSDILF